MPRLNDFNAVPGELVLGTCINARVPEADQRRQRAEVVEILTRLRRQPGVVLADEVGMGKTYVALAVAYSVAIRSPRGPVIVMAPANLIEKWAQDFRVFCELYLEGCRAVERSHRPGEMPSGTKLVRYGAARHSVELMKLLDDPPRERCHLIFLAQGAMARRQSDKWVRLALIAEALRRHGRGRAGRLIEVKKSIHRYLAELVWAIGSQNASDLGEDLWRKLLASDTTHWKRIHNDAVRDPKRLLDDDPVPKSVYRTIDDLEDLKPLAEALKQMPIRTSRDPDRTSQRIAAVRHTLRLVEEGLWTKVLAQAKWRSPLLVMDEAHHLKNPATRLARQLQSPDLEDDLRTGDGAMANSFDRMLFLTATPFQLGHGELVRVLERFGDVRWDKAELGERAEFLARLQKLGEELDRSQRAALLLQRSWSKLSGDDCPGDLETWWEGVLRCARNDLSFRPRAVIDAFHAAREARDGAESALRPWIVRHSKGTRWTDTEIDRRRRFEGAAFVDPDATEGGLPIPSAQLLPFFLAARSNVHHGQNLLGEALSSSYEAFRETRAGREAVRDESPEPAGALASQAAWFLREFDLALIDSTGASHPKVAATARKVADLWESGEKVLVFAFYRLTCKALRAHISTEIESRVIAAGLRQLRAGGRVDARVEDLERVVDRVQSRYFDDSDGPGRRAIDAALGGIVERSARAEGLLLEESERTTLLDVMRRFLRVKTTLIRCFPLAELDALAPEDAVRRMLEVPDRSNVTWRQKLSGFLDFLAMGCSRGERALYLDAAKRTETGDIRIQELTSEGSRFRAALPNIQVASGETEREQRARLMRAFNTPFFPDILVCSEVMGEGVDLQRFCRHVIHHDLAWNPSAIEQRTGRIDRLGCKAEGRHPIEVYLPYLAGTSDERQFRVMRDRERWFRVVMGEDEVARLIAPDSDNALPLPESLATDLNFHLGLEPLRRA